MSAGTAGGNWRDLSSSEVCQRLHARGRPWIEARQLVAAHERGIPEATAAISVSLER